MIKAGFQVGNEGHIDCKPWNFPQTKTALYAGKLFFKNIILELVLMRQARVDSIFLLEICVDRLSRATWLSG